MSNEENIIDIPFESIEKPAMYTIEEVSAKIGISKTKINHWIFKLNKSSNGEFFNNPSKITNEEIEHLELAQGLLEEGLGYDEIIDYIKNNKNIINKETGLVKNDLNNTDIKVISKSVTQEVKRQTDKIIDIIKNEVAIDLNNTFKEETMKIAKMSLEAMNKSNEEVIKEINVLKDQNKSLSKEIERMYSRQTEDLRERLKEKEQEINELRNRNWISKFFNRGK